MAMKKFIHTHSEIVSRHPGIVLAVGIALSLIAGYFLQNVSVESLEVRNVLPEEIDVVKSMTVLEDNYGGTSAANIIIEIDPNYKNSDEPRDVRNYEILKYQEIIQEYLTSYEDVSSTTSSTDIIKMLNDGVIPKKYSEIIQITKDNPSFDNYISKDRTLSLIRIQLQDDYDENNIASELQSVINQIPRISGVLVDVGGSSLETATIIQTVTPDMGRTSMYSIIGIIVALILMFGSIKYGLMPLTTIIVGLVWAMGLTGMIGMNLNTATSGVLSMIMGIGIDFGIQVATRFRQEREDKDIEDAMEQTLKSVLMPMIITTLAALLGFWSMGLGTITMLGEMGKIMSLGVLMCFLAAISVVPAILVISGKHDNKKSKNTKRNFLKGHSKNSQSNFIFKKNLKGGRK